MMGGQSFLLLHSYYCVFCIHEGDSVVIDKIVNLDRQGEKQAGKRWSNSAQNSQTPFAES